MKRTTLFLSVAAFVAWAAPLAAQTPPPSNYCAVDNAASNVGCNVAVGTTLTINPVMTMTLSSSSTVLTTPTANDFVAGFKTDPGPTVNVQANTAWKVVITSDPNFLGPSSTSQKLATDLLFQAPGSSAWNAVSAGAQLVAGGATAGTGPIAFNYKTLYSWTRDVPGSYSINVKFTLSAP